jgi:Tfp pilus assembly protein PilO
MSTAAPAKLALRPQERRLIAFVLIVVFVVLNIWLVWPHFSDWGQIQMRRERAQRTLRTYQSEQGKIKAYQVKLRELESAGSTVIPEEQELDLVRFVDTQARMNGLLVIQLDPRPHTSSGTQTNRFFEEQYVTLHATSDNEQLINFLGSLASTNSLIRVKDLSLKTADASATRLDEQMTLVASYQRKPPSKNAPAPTSAPATLPGAGTNKPAISHTLSRTNKAGAPPRSPGSTNKAAVAKSRLTNQPSKKP